MSFIAGLLGSILFILWMIYQELRRMNDRAEKQISDRSDALAQSEEKS